MQKLQFRGGRVQEYTFEVHDDLSSPRFSIDRTDKDLHPDMVALVLDREAFDVDDEVIEVSHHEELFLLDIGHDWSLRHSVISGHVPITDQKVSVVLMFKV